MSTARQRPRLRNRYAHVLFGIVVVAVLLFVLTRESTPETDSSSLPASTAAETDGASAPSTNSDPSVTTGATTSSASGQEEAITTTSPTALFEVLGPEGLAYREALNGFKVTLQGMVVEISAANSDWDNRAVTGARFDDVEASIADVVQRVGDFGQMVRSQVVPDALRDRYDAPEGPLQNAVRLADLVSEVLAGLRLPPPDDGTVRRAALTDFIVGVDTFNRSVDDLLLYMEENASDLGLTTMSPTTTASTQPIVDPPEETTTTTTTFQASGTLSVEATAYVQGLSRFKVMLAELVESSNETNLAWDSKEPDATYRVTESALIEVLDRITALRDAVGNHEVPEPLADRGAVVIEMAAGLVPPAEAMLEGLRLPVPEDGSTRRAALANLSRAAGGFTSAVDEVAGYVEENAESLGLLEGV